RLLSPCAASENSRREAALRRAKRTRLRRSRDCQQLTFTRQVVFVRIPPLSDPAATKTAAQSHTFRRAILQGVVTMRFPLSGECLIGGCVGLMAVSALMAERPGAAVRTEAALVDIGKVSQGYLRLTQNLEALKKDYEAKSADLKKESEA